ncbi:hypothetical protein T440DRAFT_109428 [Plenodomus tracheiphilus IPT5]|uniref:Uncharacterized protein n=1 Tax=Plenodomus tracheiphilus IPT5 TaxID=1408161 RepID=A0A6A7B7I2_9PLEO|nr:hypothetical protein T440DRAFT_109428 [Plenodomus tracheiphilus IPT5]
MRSDASGSTHAPRQVRCAWQPLLSQETLQKQDSRATRVFPTKSQVPSSRCGDAIRGAGLALALISRTRCAATSSRVLCLCRPIYIVICIYLYIEILLPRIHPHTLSILSSTLPATSKLQHNTTYTHYSHRLRPETYLRQATGRLHLY